MDQMDIQVGMDLNTILLGMDLPEVAEEVDVEEEEEMDLEAEMVMVMEAEMIVVVVLEALGVLGVACRTCRLLICRDPGQSRFRGFRIPFS